MTKVLQIITLGEQGGAQKHVLSLVNGLAFPHVRRSAFDMTLLCGGRGELLQKVHPGVKKIWMPELCRSIAPLKDIRALLKLIKIMRAGRYDIVHTHSSKAGILGRLAAKFAGVPVILYTAHGFVFQEPLFTPLKLFYFLAEKLSACWTTMLITVSRNDARIAAQLISPKKITTIHNGIDTTPHLKNKRDIPFIRELGLDPKRPILGTVANFYKTKGLAHLLKASALLPKNVQIVIIGDGPLRRSLHALTRELDLHNITWLGARTDIPKLLKQMDLFILSSVKEGFPYVILEAMASGCPIVSTRVGGIPEVLTSKGGCLVPPADEHALHKAIASLLNDKKKQLYARKNFPQIIDRGFSETTMLKKTSALYDRLLKE